MTQHEHTRGDSTMQFLKVYLGKHAFGIDILTIEDVIKRMPKTPIPLAQPCILGLLNLRGHVVTEIDVAQVLDVEPVHKGGEAESAEYALIINHHNERYSMVFDKVGEVAFAQKSQIEPLPETIDGDWHQFATGVYRMEEGLIVLLDLHSMMDLIINRIMNAVSTPA